MQLVKPTKSSQLLYNIKHAFCEFIVFFGLLLVARNQFKNQNLIRTIVKRGSTD